MSRWRKYYFQQIEQPVSVSTQQGQAGIATYQRVTPLGFVAADLAECLGWSLVSGVGVSLLHGAVTRLSSPSDTVVYAVGAIGCALLAPVLKNGAVGFAVDMADLWQRRQAAEPEPAETPKPRQPWLIPIVQDTRKKPRAWLFYEPPKGVTYAEVYKIAVAYINTKKFSEAEICKAAKVSGPTFRKFSADLRTDAKQLATKLPGNRVELTDRGKAVLSRIAFSPPPPAEWDEDR